jgi:hypothetical protein
MLNPRLFRPQTPFDSAHNVRFTHEIRSPAFMAAAGITGPAGPRDRLKRLESNKGDLNSTREQIELFSFA